MRKLNKKNSYRRGFYPGMSEAERRLGRFMRAPDGHEGEQSGGGQSEADPANPGKEQNKDGQTNPLEGFWSDPANKGEGEKSPSQADEQNQLLTQINNHIAGQKFSDSIMTPAVMNDLAEGKFDSFHKGINDAIAGGLQQQMQMTLQVMGKFGENILALVESKIGETFKAKGNEDFLLKAIPAAADPALRPMFEGIYQQALRLADGNREIAIAKTKEMAAHFVNKGAPDLGISLGGGSKADDPTDPGAGINWLEMLARK